MNRDFYLKIACYWFKSSKEASERAKEAYHFEPKEFYLLLANVYQRWGYERLTLAMKAKKL